MVPTGFHASGYKGHSPRIRGDGPLPGHAASYPCQFSPYSRGWSHAQGRYLITLTILPVFAGMVPLQCPFGDRTRHFPRIRGDGPMRMPICRLLLTFSPYSRGWSQGGQAADTCIIIFPVFAGMVRCTFTTRAVSSHFPRIRGDGPRRKARMGASIAFSPYSRGWSRVIQ